MFRFLFLVVFFILSINAMAQRPGGGGRPGGAQAENKAIIKGLLVDELGEGVPFATVAIYKENSDELLQGVTTDFNGGFRVKIVPMLVRLKIDFLGLQTIDKTLDLKLGLNDLGELVMLPDESLLDEVVVTGEKSTMELKLDKRVFTVGKDLNSIGSSATELLDNVPSVNVDIDGNVSMRGSENIRILIDGKPSGLVGLGGNEGLNSIPANLIEKVEVVTNPSARFDAEGEAGIINLVLKKQKEKGVNGSFDFTLGYPERAGVSVNMNFRREKVNFFTNFGLGYTERDGGGDYFQKIYELSGVDNDTIIQSIYRSERSHTRGGVNANIQLGADFLINDLETITVSGLYKYSKGSNNAEVIYQDFDVNDSEILLETVRTDAEAEPSHDGELALNYSKRFLQKDRSWSTDVKFLLRDDTETSAFQEVASDARPDVHQRSDNVEDQRNWVAQTDYVHPFPKGQKLETGLKGSWRNFTNRYKVEQEDEAGTWNIFNGFDDQMLYTENIYAGYGIYSKEAAAFSWQLGLRIEHSDITTDVKSENNPNRKTYTDFFPSVHMSYKLSEKNQWQLSYSRRITRPRFWFLLPFVTFSDVRLRWQGNPDLNPEYTDSYELGYLRFFEKGSLLSSLYYRHRTSVIQRLFLTNELGEIDFLPVNMGVQNAVGLELSGNYEFSSFWKLNANVNFFQAKTEGSYLDVQYEAETFAWDGRVVNKFTIKKEWNTQVAFNYKSGQNTTQGRRLAVWAIDLGVSKDVFGGKGTLSLNAKDLLNTRRRRSITDVQELYSEQSFQWRSRSVVLNLNYRLNQKKKRGGRAQGSWQ